mmetsp:Transcript_8594/g.21984  ORF Transcript_8594/g.21984 Transcript_8594/m.21984 type:complete len:220 (+) Transcript_8594:434-1093(+)
MARTSSPDRMKEANTASTPRFTPQLSTDASYSVNGGKSSVVPGQLTPLRSPSSPPFKARHTTSSPLTSLTSSSTSPSSRKMRDPITTLLCSGWSTNTPVASPLFLHNSFVWSVNVWPGSTCTFSPPTSIPVRTSGPLVSTAIAQSSVVASCEMPFALRCLRIFCRLSTRAPCSSYCPWLKFMRMHVMPDLSTSSSGSIASECGPIVHTIPEFRGTAEQP